jgi:DNA repair protein RadD
MWLYDIFRNWPSQRVLVITHVKELIAQNYEKLKLLWPEAPAGIYSAGIGRKDTFFPITFCGVASIAKNASSLFGHVDLILIDEAHLVSPDELTMYRKIIDMLMVINPKLRVIGYTATPWRLGGGHLTECGLFTDVAFDMGKMEPFNWLLDQGYLLPIVSPKTDTILDTEGLHKRGGDFIEKEMQVAFDKSELTESIVRESIRMGAKRHSWLAFCSGIEHAENMAECFNMYGIETAAVHSKMKGDRDKIIRAFQHGDIKCVTNNGVLTTGFDHPALDMIIMARATDSATLWVQMCGRGTRPVYVEGFDLKSQEGRLASIANSQKQNTLLLDFARNTKRNGPINDPLIPRKKGSGKGDAPVKECPECGCTVHASLRVCNGLRPFGTLAQQAKEAIVAETMKNYEADDMVKCGFVFPIASKLNLVAASDDIIKSDLPIFEVFKVSHISYAIQKSKSGGIPMLKVTYYYGHQSVTEFVCPEHPPKPNGGKSFPRLKAEQWWALRCGKGDKVPDTAAEMLEIVNMLPQPKHVNVWTNKQYPELMRVDFSGTAFGTEAKSEDSPQVEVVEAQMRGVSFNLGAGAAASASPRAPAGVDEYDDDIPF